MTDVRDVQALLTHVEAGEQLPDSDRQATIAHLLFARGELLPLAELARLFNVDVEVVEHDLGVLKRNLAEAQGLSPEDADLAFNTLVEVAAIDRYLVENRDRLRPAEFAGLLRERREAVTGLRDRLSRKHGWD